MSVKIQHFEPLAEDERLAYLQAMDIPVWVLREEPLNEDLVDEECTPEQSIESEQQAASSQNPNSEPELTQQITEEPLVEETNQVEIPALEPSEQEISYVANCFLKMVNWQSKSNADKSLLIICRHQIDQPAQSFARPNGPSQFMSDYIQAINELIIHENFEIQVQLAHLTEAGLGNDNQPLQKTLNEINPDLILLLGEESIKLLFNSQQDVAQLRGKLKNIGLLKKNNDQQIEKLSEIESDQQVNPKILVSYHPYTLIENPPLKKLALEDLSLLIKVLKNG